MELWPSVSSAPGPPGHPGFVGTQMTILVNDSTQSPGAAGGGGGRHKDTGADTPGLTRVCTIRVTLDDTSKPHFLTSKMGIIIARGA